jgi:hypothetical protein
VDQRREDGWHDDERAVHDEDHFAGCVQLLVRDVAGWNEVDDGDGREGYEGKVICSFGDEEVVLTAGEWKLQPKAGAFLIPE